MKNLKQILYSLYRVICIALTTALFTWFIGMNGQHGRKHLAKLMFCILEKKKKKSFVLSTAVPNWANQGFSMKGY